MLKLILELGLKIGFDSIYKIAEKYNDELSDLIYILLFAGEKDLTYYDDEIKDWSFESFKEDIEKNILKNDTLAKQKLSIRDMTAFGIVIVECDKLSNFTNNYYTRLIKAWKKYLSQLKANSDKAHYKDCIKAFKHISYISDQINNYSLEIALKMLADAVKVANAYKKK